jgi:hypothetical protein
VATRNDALASSVDGMRSAAGITRRQGEQALGLAARQIRQQA